MRLLALLFGLLVPLLAGSLPAKAQTPVALMCWQGPTNPQWAPCSATTPLQTSGSGGAGGGGGGGSGSIASSFVPNGSFATLTATASSASVALPTGFAVLFQNVGTTTVSCTVGIGSATATANELIIPANSPFLVLPGANTFGACIDQTGAASNLVVIAGGALQDHTDLTSPVPTQDASVSIGGVGIVATTLAVGGLTPVVCGSAVSSCVFKAGAGNLYSAYAECTAACWLMIFNSTTAPSNGATTAGVASGNMVECVDVAAASSKSISFSGMPPEVYSVGITAAISSTACATLTLSTVAFVKGSVK